MKSSSGHYYIGLDHLRAIAVFMVFFWHFGENHPPHISLFPLSLLTQGYTGVALFMTLSGYLFAKLLDKKRFKYKWFIWNRLLRLIPLLFVVVVVVGFEHYLKGDDLLNYATKVMMGIITPTLPNGGWSITAEFHFYLILPLLLFATKKNSGLLIIILLMALVLRAFLHHKLEQIQLLSYFTIIGRIDQFLLGILAYKFRSQISNNHIFIFFNFIIFALFFWYFQSQGGFWGHPSFPSPSSIWIFIPTIEGIAYALIISWYDNSFEHSTGALSRFFAMIGTYSYSIYLLHFFIVFRLSNAIDLHIADLSNQYANILFSTLCFLIMIPIGYFSFKYIESPFLKFRTKYILPEEKIILNKD